MLNIVLALFPLVALITLGYVIKRSGFLTEAFWHGAERLNYYILFPALFIHVLSQAQINGATIKWPLLAMLLIFFIATVLLYGFKWYTKSPPARFGVHVQSILRFNSYISLALVYGLYQQPGMEILAILLAAGVPVVNIVSVCALNQNQHMDFLSLFKSLLKNPLINSCVFGAMLNILAVPLWQGLQDLLKLLSAASLPLGLLCVGAALQFKAMQHNMTALLADSLVRLLAMPCLAFVVCQWLPLSQLEGQIVVLFFALPTASAAYILTKVLKGDSQLMAAVISTQTLCAAFSLPLILFLLSK